MLRLVGAQPNDIAAHQPIPARLPAAQLFGIDGGRRRRSTKPGKTS
jgi:hypothetical protein